MLFSAPEFRFTRDGVAQNLRSDGRENHQQRPVEISLGNHECKLSKSFNKKKRNMMIITRAVGQAKVRLGKGSCGRTEVVCAITGQVCSFDEDEEEDDALLLFMGQRRSGGGGGRDKSGTTTGGNDKAGTSTGTTTPSVEVYVETMSTRNVGSAVCGGGKGQHQQQVFNETDKYCGELKRELEFAYGSMDLLNKESGLRKSLEIGGSSHGSGSKQGGRRRHRWKLRMDFLVLSDDGNALDALAIAGKCALFDARLPRVRVKRRGEDEEVELVSDSEEEDDDDDDDEQLEKGKEKESNSSSSNTTLDVSDVPLIATATYFGRARQQEGVTMTTTITIDDEEFLPTIAIDCVSSEESCGDFALAVSATREGAVTSVQRVGGFGNSSAMAVESDVSDNVIKFARKHCVKIHGEIDSYLSTLALREDEGEEDEDSLASSESEDEEMEEANQDEF